MAQEILGRREKLAVLHLAADWCVQIAVAFPMKRLAVFLSAAGFRVLPACARARPLLCHGRIEAGRADAPELPLAPLKLSLTRHVTDDLFRVIVVRAVAFDSEARLQAFDNEVNPIAAWPERFVLRNESEILCVDYFSNLALKIAFALFPVWFTSRLRGWITVIGEQLIPHVIGVKLIDRDGVEQPHLIAPATWGDVEPLLVGFLHQCSEALVRRGDHA